MANATFADASLEAPARANPYANALPGTAGYDVGGFGADGGDPFGQRLGYEFGAVAHWEHGSAVG